MTEDGAIGLASLGDEFYEALMSAHDGLTEAESHGLNARLVLLMANRIGNVGELKDLLIAARAYD